MIGILFDFNGTMFFDEKFQEEAWKTFMSQKIGRDITDEEFQEYIHGRNANDSLTYFLKRTLTKQEVAELEEEKEIIYRELCLNSHDFKLADGLIHFLDELKKRNIPMTIATASCYNNVQFFFDNLDLDRWFDITKVAYNDGNIPGKPEPDLYLKAAENIGVDIQNCVIFEDSNSGIESARRAGVAKIIKVDSMNQIGQQEDLAGTICDFKNIEALLGMMGM